MPLRATPGNENRPFARLQTGTPKAYFQDRAGGHHPSDLPNQTVSMGDPSQAQDDNWSDRSVPRSMSQVAVYRPPVTASVCPVM